jgi:carbamoyl-phosphate synthase large subunit
MKSVGEAMSIGRTFKESFQKGLRSMENKRFGFGFDGKDFSNVNLSTLLEKLKRPNPDRLFYIKLAFENGFTVDQIFEFTKIDPWFLHQMQQITEYPKTIMDSHESIREAKQYGFSDFQLAKILQYKDEPSFRARRESLGIKPVYKLVDTCAGEFEATTPYFYSTYEDEDEVTVSDRKKVMILGGGPNRIGQGIEFDYCCVHAAMAAHDEGFESIMVNSNPETVSTDYDTSDKLYFEPLTFEDVLNIVDKEKPEGVIIQFGGQTPLNLSVALDKAGVKILGTSSDNIDRAEDRERFKQLIQKLQLRQPENLTVTSVDQALEAALKIGYPMVVRPSYVLGGAAMKICRNETELVNYMANAKDVSPAHPILLDRYLVDAVEVDVDALSDGRDCVIAGIMEHVEEAGVHSGDSACFLPPFSLSQEIQSEIRHATRALALELQVKGLLNIQFAICNKELYVLEVNPRASRTVPFVSKATGVQWAKMATRVLLGKSVASLGLKEVIPKHWCVKEAVFPFNRFPGTDPLLSPEMKSTGEVMGVDLDPGLAFYKAQIAAYQNIPTKPSKIGYVMVESENKNWLYTLLSKFEELGHQIEDLASRFDETKGKFQDPKMTDLALMVSLPSIKGSLLESTLRQSAIKQNVPIITTKRGLECTVHALKSMHLRELEVYSLQELTN